MPQLVPFYFTNETVFVFLAIMFMLYLFSVYILPGIFRAFSIRNVTIIV